MSEASTSPIGSFVQRVTPYTFPIIAVALGLFAFHWQALHGEESRIRERSEVRSQTLAETAALALREPILNKNVPAVMILVEGLVRESHDVLSARVGGKDGKAIAETEAEHIDRAELDSARTLTQPILVQDGSGTAKAIGTIDLRVSTKEIAQVAEANMTPLAIEGGVCLILCGGLIVLSRKKGLAPVNSGAKRIGAGRSTSTVPHAMKNDIASTAGKHQTPATEPRGIHPTSDSSADDEPVEVTLTSAPSTSEQH